MVLDEPFGIQGRKDLFVNQGNCCNKPTIVRRCLRKVNFLMMSKTRDMKKRWMVLGVLPEMLLTLLECDSLQWADKWRKREFMEDYKKT